MLPLLVAGSSAAAQAAPASCRGVPATIVGSGELTGTDGRDVIVATRPDTRVRAGGGDDLICGSRFVRAQAGDDEIHFSGAVTGADDLYISGGPGDDVIRFHKRQVNTALGTDVGVFGGPGADLIVGDKGSLWFSGGAGDDRLVGGSGTFLLDGNAGDDVLRGGPDQDIMSGGDGNDRLYGYAASDDLSGGRGVHDEVWGGRDWDVCARGNEIEHTCEADDWV
jgi:Ca2+-binding RTX toxin-like protein